ncbi:MAG: hypothetical protein M3Y77_18685 [Actinomycetota bacterium]|nr:hypothetical protein [Actinomycetota bacterium]
MRRDGDGVVSVLGFLLGLLIWLAGNHFRPTTTTTTTNGGFGAVLKRMVAGALKWGVRKPPEPGRVPSPGRSVD